MNENRKQQAGQNQAGQQKPQAGQKQQAGQQKQQAGQTGKSPNQGDRAPAQYGDQNDRSAQPDPRQRERQHEVGQRDTGHAGETGRGRSAPAK